MLNLPPNHFDPGLTALIANRVFIMENPNGGIDIVFTDGAEHFQVVNMAVDIVFFKIISSLVARLFGGRMVKTTGPVHIEHIGKGNI